MSTKHGMTYRDVSSWCRVVNHITNIVIIISYRIAPYEQYWSSFLCKYHMTHIWSCVSEAITILKLDSYPSMVLAVSLVMMLQLPRSRYIWLIWCYWGNLSASKTINNSVKIWRNADYYTAITLVKYKSIKVSFGDEPIPLYDVFLIHCFSWPEIERSREYWTNPWVKQLSFAHQVHAPTAKGTSSFIAIISWMIVMVRHLVHLAHFGLPYNPCCNREFRKISSYTPTKQPKIGGFLCTVKVSTSV